MSNIKTYNLLKDVIKLLTFMNKNLCVINYSCKSFRRRPQFNLLDVRDYEKNIVFGYHIWYCDLYTFIPRKMMKLHLSDHHLFVPTIYFNNGLQTALSLFESNNKLFSVSTEVNFLSKSFIRNIRHPERKHLRNWGETLYNYSPNSKVKILYYRLYNLAALENNIAEMLDYYDPQALLRQDDHSIKIDTDKLMNYLYESLNTCCQKIITGQY